MGFTSFSAAGLLLLTCTSAVYAADPIDVNRLPIDRQRIHRALQQSTIREERQGLNLRYTVDVYAPAPPIVIFTREDNLTNGPVPYGAPTHRQMVEQMTPQEYRAPAADLNALVRWLIDRAQKK